MRPMRPAVLLLLLLASCGSGGGAAPTVALVTVDSVTAPLASSGGEAYVVTGTNFPGAAGSAVAVRFTAAEGTPFQDCTTATVQFAATRVSGTRIDGTTGAFDLIGDVTAFVTVVFEDASEATSAEAIATWNGEMDPARDQDMNGVADRCDPNTYDFEDDAVGARPAGTTALDGLNPGFVVKDVAGDRVAGYTNGTSTGVYDRLDRLQADHARQNTTAYVDFEDAPSTCSLEFWSDGSWAGLAGAGLIFQVQPNGQIVFFERLWRSVPATFGPFLPASGRLRMRILKGPGTTSAFHVDAWENDAWTVDYAVFPIADDHIYLGRDTVLGEYSGGTRGIERITVVHELPAAPLVLAKTPEGATDWKVFQRDGFDRATIPLRFLYRLSMPGRVQARVVRSDTQAVLPLHDWTDHEQTLPVEDGARGTLDVGDVPVGGNYDIEVRLVDDATQAVLGQDELADVAVGDVYLAIGQSNMSGYSGTLAGATAPIPEAHVFGNDGIWKQAEEPMDGGVDQRDAVSREFPAHSLLLPFARGLFEATGVPVGIIPGSLGGTNLYAQWQRNALDPDHRVTLYGSALHRGRMQQYETPLRGLLWFQGESDAIAARTTALYRADLERLVNGYRTDLGRPDLVFLCAQLGTWSAANLDRWTAVQEAQRQVAAADPRAALITTVDQPRSDAIHYSVAGYQEIGARFADAARALLFGHAIDPLTELWSAMRTLAGDAIELTYDAAVTGGDPALYVVVDDAGTAGVTGVSVSGTVVTLQLDRVLGSNPRVSYGYAVVPTAPWVEDLAGVPVPCFAGVPVGP